MPLLPLTENTPLLPLVTLQVHESKQLKIELLVFVKKLNG